MRIGSMTSVITDPTAKTILCYGDSNTHGIPSNDEDDVRLPADVRWTGRLQLLLGEGYDVIEEGLSGRTTNVDYDDRPGANGRPYFAPCLQTHHPLDVVVIMLGTNDLKLQFDRPATAIADALSGYIDDIANQRRRPKRRRADDDSGQPGPARRQPTGVRRAERREL
jgi:lysophospholipase L1-like esterase